MEAGRDRPAMEAGYLELFDTHCHLADPAYAGDLEAVLARAWEAGLAGMLCVGYDVASSRAAVALAERDPRIWAAVGVHPHNVAEEKASRPSPGELEAELRVLAGHPRVVALGEAGLDFYRDLSPRPLQRDIFRLQAGLARELGLPLVVHDRDAHDECLTVLVEYYGGAGPTVPPQPVAPATAAGAASVMGAAAALPPGVMHCFSGDRALAESCLGLGFYLSFAGPLTYPKADGARAVAAWIPSDRVFIETDCPYLAPQTRRGRRNEPAYVAEVARTLAAVRGIAPDRAASLTTANARRLLGLS